MISATEVRISNERILELMNIAKEIYASKEKMNKIIPLITTHKFHVIPKDIVSTPMLNILGNTIETVSRVDGITNSIALFEAIEEYQVYELVELSFVLLQIRQEIINNTKPEFTRLSETGELQIMISVDNDIYVYTVIDKKI